LPHRIRAGRRASHWEAVVSSEQHRVLYERSGAVAYITLNRPEKLNALTKAMHGQVVASLRRFEAEDDARLAVLRGAERAFCAGRDLKEQVETGRSPTDRVDATVTGYGVPALSKPLVTSGRGPAIGVGGYMLMAGDVRIASTTLHFALTEVPTGVLGPYWLQQCEMLPPAVAFRLAMGDRLDVDELKHWGLVTEVVEDAQLEDATQGWVDRLLRLQPQHVVATKALMKKIGFAFTDKLFRGEQEHRARLDALADTREAALAFVERRAARFTGS
jgi:enoyl-CoA hydratase/carnithine racemase